MLKQIDTIKDKRSHFSPQGVLDLGPDATKYLTIVVVKNLPLLCVGRRNLWYESISADRVTRDKHFGTIFDAIRGLCGLQNACKTVLGNCSPPQVPNNIVEMLIFFYIINFITQQLLLLLHRITNCIQRHADPHMQQYVIVIAEYLPDSRCCGLGNIIII